LKAAGQTYKHMATAIIAMLMTLGSKAEHSRDDYRPHAVRVIAHPDIRG